MSSLHEPDFLPDEMLCANAACGHPASEHSEILGCAADCAAKEGGGVDFSCACGTFEIPAVDRSLEPARGEA